MTWQPLLHNWNRSAILSYGNGERILSLGQRVTYRGDEGVIQRFDRGRALVRLDRGTVVAQLDDLSPATPRQQSTAEHTSSLAQAIAEDHARYARAQASADLKRLRGCGASYGEILAAGRLEESLGYAE